MTLRPEYSLGHSEYNAFLFASVGEEKTGLQLTVQTALIRLGFDPWQEAARLSDLPKAAAAQALAAAMARLPDGDWKAAGLPEIAARLLNSLPGRSTPVVPLPKARRSDAKAPKAALSKATGPKATGPNVEGTKSTAAAWLIWVALAAALFIGVMAMQGNNDFESAPGDGSAVQRDNNK
jgi:hypothetical protein